MRVLVLITILVTGCMAATPTVTTLKTPDGRDGYYISCAFSTADWSMCYNEAAKRCGGAYTVLDRFEANTTVLQRHMVVSCS